MSTLKYCNCDEMQLTTGRRLPMPDLGGAWHDCQYVRQRSALVPQATLIADRLVPEAVSLKAPPAIVQKWSRVFARAMDNLAKPLM